MHSAGVAEIGDAVADEFRSCLDTGPLVPFDDVQTAVETTLVAAGKSPEVGQVAWKDSTYCRSCHDAGSTNEFPHYTPGAARFLLSAPDFTSYSSAPASIGANPSMDGACLKCHKNNATTGVGQTY